MIADGVSETSISRISTLYEDPRIEFFTYPEKQGIGRMFNHCLDLLNSDWNMILGADDILSSDFLENLIDGIEFNPSVQMIQPKTRIIDSDGKEITTLEDSVKSIVRNTKKPYLFKSREAIYSLSIGNWLYFPSIIWSSRALNLREFDLSLEIVLDLDFVLKILADGGEILYWPKSLFFYRRHIASVSMKPDRFLRRAEEEVAVYDQLAKRLWGEGRHFAALVPKIRLTSRLNLVLKVIRSPDIGRKHLIKLLCKF